jgi:hypothetical protein
VRLLYLGWKPARLASYYLELHFSYGSRLKSEFSHNNNSKAPITTIVRNPIDAFYHTITLFFNLLLQPSSSTSFFNLHLQHHHHHHHHLLPTSTPPPPTSFFNTIVNQHNQGKSTHPFYLLYSNHYSKHNTHDGWETKGRR